MSSFIEKVKPLNGTHSIKEVAISLFLVNQIARPERFQKLIQTSFKDKFRQFNTLERVQVQIQKKHSGSSINTNTVKNTGFKFTGFDSQGKISTVFQGQNDENRTFVSFHCLNYINWSAFYQDYLSTIKVLSEEPNDFFIQSFSLQYIDVFNWDGEIGDFKTELFFNNKSEILPSKFFEAKFNRNYLLTIEEEYEGLTFFDRIEVKTENKLLPEITISHNVAHQLNVEQDLKALLVGETFTKMLTIAHRRNKDTLNEVLSTEIGQLINL